MPTPVIVENDPAVHPLRGGNLEMWKYRGIEAIVAGPAGTGKTYSCGLKLHSLCMLYPGTQAVMIRKVRDTMHGTVISTFLRKVVPAAALESGQVKVYGGEKAEWIDYANGSRIWIAGMDNPGKALSSERDFAYINQAEEIDLTAWETITTRCTGRAGNAPWSQVFGDCNPGPPFHWIKKREGLRIFESRHEDNPVLHQHGDWTDEGRKTLAILDALTGVRKERLRYGRWVSAEGLVYEFDPRVHLVDPFHIPPHWPRCRSIDFGYSNPFVCLWACLDPDGRLYVYRELYMSQRTVAEHVPTIRAESEDDVFECTVADHDREDRETLHQQGIWTLPALKAIEPGIQAVKDRLALQPDGKPRLMVFRNCLIERDPLLAELGQPTCLEEEMSMYQWAPPSLLHKKVTEVPLDKWNHACDGLRYLCLWADSRGYSFEGQLKSGGSNLGPKFRLVFGDKIKGVDIKKKEF